MREEASDLKPLLVKQHDALLRCLRCLDVRFTRHESLLENILKQGHWNHSAAVGSISPVSEAESSLELIPRFNADLYASFESDFEKFSDQHGEEGTKQNSDDDVDIKVMRNGDTSGLHPTYEDEFATGQEPSIKHNASAKKRCSTFSNELVVDEALHRAEASRFGRLSSRVTETSEHNAARRVLRTIVKSGSFEVFVSFLVVTNSTLIGAEAEYVAINEISTPPLAFRVLGWSYALIFLVELLARLFVDGFDFFRSSQKAWNILDTLIVIASVCEVIIDLFFADLRSASSNAMILRTGRLIRTLRLLRTIRIASIIKYISALQTMIHLIFATLRSLVWAIVLMIMIVYVFGIWFTQAATTRRLEASTEQQDSELILFWGSLGTSMFTLYKSVTGGVSWHDVTLPLGRISWIWVGLFTAYVSFTYFAVLNVVTGVFCNSAFETAKRNPEVVVQSMVADQQWYEKHLRELFKKFHKDETGNVRLRELEKHMKEESVIACFFAMSLEISDAWALFQLIDTDGTYGISETEFVHGCMQLSGAAKNLDIASMRYEFKTMFKKMAKLMRRLQADIHNCTLICSDQRRLNCSSPRMTGFTSQKTLSSTVNEVPPFAGEMTTGSTCISSSDVPPAPIKAHFEHPEMCLRPLTRI